MTPPHIAPGALVEILNLTVEQMHKLSGQNGHRLPLARSIVGMRFYVDEVIEDDPAPMICIKMEIPDSHRPYDTVIYFRPHQLLVVALPAPAQSEKPRQ